MDTNEERIRRVLRRIEEDYADELDLDALAAVACLSRFHFSRVFSAYAGEGPMESLARVRVERAAELLASTGEKIADIAFACGFGSLSAFNATFKARVGATPGEYRKNPRELRNESEEPCPASVHTPPRNDFSRRILDMNVAVIEMAEREIAYVYKKGSLLDNRPAWDTLIAWAAERGIRPPEEFFIGMSDDPTIVPEDECSFYACATLPPGFEKQPGPVEYDSLPGGLYATYEFYDRPDRISLAYGVILRDWLPGSGYAQDSARPCFEISLNDPGSDPEGRARARLCVPLIRPRSG
jgi:AraC family transcriptional regulator